jgi:RNA-binding protein
VNELTGRQKRKLRSLGQRLGAAVTVGATGCSGATLRTLRALLEKHELIKVRLRTGEGRQRKQAAQHLAEATDSTCAAVIGKTVLLYRPSAALDDDERIALP